MHQLLEITVLLLQKEENAEEAEEIALENISVAINQEQGDIIKSNIPLAKL